MAVWAEQHAHHTWFVPLTNQDGNRYTTGTPPIMCFSYIALFLSNTFFSKPKTTLNFYLTRFFHKIRKTFAKEKFSDSIFLKCNKSLSKHLNPSSHYIFTVIYSCLLERQLFWLKLSDWINSSYPFLYRIFCSKSGLWK